MPSNLKQPTCVYFMFQVGPAGSQFGLLACLIVEVLNAWPMLKHPNQALCKLLSITIFLFFVGLLPWVDNYAHLFGFIFGFLLSYAFLPFISFGPYDRQKKIALIWVCLLSALTLFICLVLLFYIIPVYDCKICSYFNCLPITSEFCASQNINFKREEPIVWHMARLPAFFIYSIRFSCQVKSNQKTDYISCLSIVTVLYVSN